MITFTDRAREVVHTFLDQSNEDNMALRIGTGAGTGSPNFDLALVSQSERTEDEQELDAGGFTLLIKTSDCKTLEGATVDYVERVNESGFEVRPASASSSPKDSEVTIPQGDIADRVRDVLNTQVNPAIASHGGMISLVNVEETDVYVEMSGGCQGCALSRMTLRQGVERMLREAVPELTAIHDITDHESGDNPYL